MEPSEVPECGCFTCSISSKRRSGRRAGTGNFHEAALRGSSHYDLPAILHWFTGNIGVHHVHHLCSRIPYYRLPQTLREHPDPHGVSRLTLLALWDESQLRLVSFRDITAATRGSRQ